MRVQKIIAIVALSIGILFGFLTIENKAVDETNNSTAAQNATNTQSSQNTAEQNNSRNKANEKSSNANLSNLGIKPHDFKGFKAGVTSYEVAVPEDTESVEVYATTQHAKATVTGTGKKTLEKGENNAQVVVTAEDGTTKTYTINIIREIQQEQESVEVVATSENDNTDIKGLDQLKIDNINLLPEFKTDVYEYTAKYIGENTKLKIEAKPTDDNYEVEIIGNDNLKEGQNVITILVSESNGNNIATYQITVDKNLVDEDAIAKEEVEKKEQRQKIVIGIGIVAVVVVVVILVIIIVILRHRRRKDEEWEEEFAGKHYYEDDTTDEEEDNEVPKAFGKRFQEELEESKEENKEENFEEMSKDKLKEEFLNGYTSKFDIDFEDTKYQNNRRKAKHRGKRFK